LNYTRATHAANEIHYSQ